MKPFRDAWPNDPPYNRPIQIERIIKFNVVPDELVSRLLVLIHPMIQNNLVWKNDVVIFDKAENTQSYIRVETSLSRFVVTIRGSDLTHCKNLLEWIITQVEIVCDKYKSISFEQMIRSPHSSKTEISIEQVKSDLSLPLNERKLICPDTFLPILSEKVLNLMILSIWMGLLKGRSFGHASLNGFILSK